MRDGLRPAEDDQVKRAVSELPEMSDEAFAAGRAKLLARMGKTEPAAVAVEEPAAVTEPVAVTEPAAVVVPRQRRSRHIAWLAAAAIVVGVLVLTLVGPSFVPQNGSGGPEPKIGSAVAAEALSQAASKTGDVVLQPGQFLYVRDRTIVSSMAGRDDDHIDYAYTQDETYETWVPADQGQTWEHRRTSSGRKTWLKGSPADLDQDIPDPMVLGDWKAKGGAPWGTDIPPATFFHPTPAYLAALPRDPKQLYEKLRADAAGDQGIELFRQIRSGLDTGLIPADLRKAAYQALAYLPNLEVVGQDKDLDGRPGEAFGLVDGKTLSEIIIDPNTGEYLGSRDVLVKDMDGMKAGTVLGSSTLTTKVVTGLGHTS